MKMVYLYYDIFRIYLSLFCQSSKVFWQQLIQLLDSLCYDCLERHLENKP